MRISQSDVSNYIKVAANRARSFLSEAVDWEKPEEYDPILDYEFDFVDELLLGESTLVKMREAAEENN